MAPAPDRPQIIISYEVDPVDPERRRTVEPVAPVDPPPPVERLDVARAAPGTGPAPTDFTPPDIEPAPVSTSSLVNLDALARPIVRIEPVFPDRMARMGISGYCVIVFDVTPQGRTANIAARDCSHEGFARTTIQAVERWRYQPAVTDGQPRWMRGLQVRLDYRID